MPWKGLSVAALDVYKGKFWIKFVLEAVWLKNNAKMTQLQD